MGIARSCFCACSTLALIAGGGSAALAQDSEAQASASTSAQGTEGPVIIVTAQKRVERLIDVPIAITALSNEALDDYKIEGGSELLRAVPNVNFSKSNFSMYNFSIRGIGTKAISAASDPAVAVSFNNIPLIRNRLFESEFFDMERIEVLRGPQGTLYGRNATSGVVNMIPAMPEFTEVSGEVRAEAGSYATRRLGGHLNVPLSDTLAVRAAGMMTKRNGYDFNTYTNKRVNGRDLWSTRLSLAWEPSENFRASFIWQHFEEDDNRSRTGKQLCTRDPGPTQIGDTTVPFDYTRAKLSQGCLAASLYDDAAYGAPNLLGSSQFFAAAINLVGYKPDTREPVNGLSLLSPPYRGITQSRNLREIETAYDPVFRANNDIFQLNFEFTMGDVGLYSQTTFAKDSYYSSQDYNRFVSVPIFPDSAGLVNALGIPLPNDGLTPGGIYTDPQLGPSDRWVAVDISQSENEQWFQELRLTSDMDGPLNFNLGANYLNFDTQDDYYVMSNVFSYIAELLYNRRGNDIIDCSQPETVPGECVYVDPNPIDQIDGEGHNYFRSKNVVEIESWGVFGELYWDVTEDLKVTLGGRYTKDTKTTTPIPTQLLLGAEDYGQSTGTTSGGYISRGFREFPDTVLKSDAFTGRFVVDWRPVTSFTDDTMFYASASRGYKAGGTNPPRIDVDPEVIQYEPLPADFEPEYVTAFEIGTKNVFAGGRFSLNATAFLNLYKDYQVSQIVDRISLNENFDATTWGAELEAAWAPTERFRVDATLGFLQTRIGDGEQSIDVMNRTQGNEDWVLVRPSPAVPSNCIAPRDKVEAILNSPFTAPPDGSLSNMALGSLCAGSKRYGSWDPEREGLPLYAMFGFTYDPLTDAPNGGRGFFADLSGNELPNAPHLTFNIGAQYTLPIDGGDWQLTLRGDYYRQSESYARVYNTEIDRLKAWDNVNAALTLTRPQDDFSLQLYVKNVFNDAPITDFFLNSDDTGLTANVFTLDPRIIGLRATVGF
ncbi:TonB-dependent receptor [Pelagerythrobacter marensis]|uniref:TonB-dependent receptor n=1 Tax=Pelagerythrobacter marensis TaxID=543877 RepID=A0ABZ2D623_9SPHN